MNEQIQKLALQAKLGPALLLHHWGTVDALTDSEQNELEQIEKFAELIILECDRYARGTWEHGHLLGGDLKRLFGFEE